jgi:hypothetical protein
MTETRVDPLDPDAAVLAQLPAKPDDPADGTERDDAPPE